MEYKRKFSNDEIFDWLWREYGSNFASVYYNQAANDRVMNAHKNMCELDSKSNQASDEVSRQKLKIASMNQGIDMMIVNNDITHKVTLGYISMLIQQIRETSTPNLPKEFYGWVEGLYENYRRNI